MASKKRPILIVASPSWRFGWGVYTNNLALQWHSDPDLALFAGMAFNTKTLIGLEGLDPGWRIKLEAFIAASQRFQQRIRAASGPVLEISCPVLLPFLDQMNYPATASGQYVFGRPTIGMVFSSDTLFDGHARERARRCVLHVAGSRWNRQALQAAGIGPVATVLQGVEPSLFRPGARQGQFVGRFAIFSGGKLEYRKGQDLVMRAFRSFHRRHSDALLVTAWHSPWPQLSRSLGSADLAAPPLHARGHIDVPGWAAACGLPANAIVDLGIVSQPRMPEVFREMDVALFANRCEGGTNLVAMEAMACGVPTILSANTGHLDLMENDNCYPLIRQGAVDPIRADAGGAEGWGESDVEEIVETLETIYTNREQARERGIRGAATLARFTWARQAAALKEAIIPYFP